MSHLSSPAYVREQLSEIEELINKIEQSENTSKTGLLKHNLYELDSVIFNENPENEDLFQFCEDNDLGFTIFSELDLISLKNKIGELIGKSPDKYFRLACNKGVKFTCNGSRWRDDGANFYDQDTDFSLKWGEENLDIQSKE